MARPALKPWPELAKHLEPAVSPFYATEKCSMETYVSLSAAVSAKRQADALDRIADALNLGFADRLEEALNRGISSGASDAISAWQHRR